MKEGGKKLTNANKLGTYDCPHSKFDGSTQAPSDSNKTLNVQGRYCKNNCGIYRSRKCKRFN